MKQGDKIIYYSPKLSMESNCQIYGSIASGAKMDLENGGSTSLDYRCYEWCEDGVILSLKSHCESIYKCVQYMAHERE